MMMMNMFVHIAENRAKFRNWCVCVCARVRACVRACVCVCVHGRMLVYGVGASGSLRTR